MNLRAIAIDDEPLALSKLSSFIERTPKINLLATFDNPLEALIFLKINEVDLIFLDIQMEELSGLQFMDALEVKSSIIITSAYEKYAIKGYDYDIVDYLLKPFSFDRYLQAIDKVKLEDNKEQNSNAIFIKSGYNLQRVDIDSILYIKGMSEYLQIVTANSSIMTLSSFSQMLELLPTNNFIRIHRSYLVAKNKIKYIGQSSVVMQNGEELPIGNSYKYCLKKRLFK